MDTKNGKKALVTGGTGFLGRNLVKYLLDRGWNVVCLVRPNSRHGVLTEMGAELVLGDFTQEEILKKAVENVDVVFHVAGCVAALTLEKVMQVNCQYSENLVRVCAEKENPPIFVYVSSLAAAGPSTPERPHEEDDPCKPISWYGKSKFAAEMMLRGYAERLPITVVRPPMLFGPYDHEVVKWFQGIRKSGIFFIPFIRNYRFSMAHVDDVCQLLVLASEKGDRMVKEPETQGQAVYYVSQTEHPTYMEMGKIFGTALGRKRTFILPVSPIVMRIVCGVSEFWAQRTGKVTTLGMDKYREVSAGSWSCSADKARKQLGFQNQGTLQEQCNTTAKWILEHEK
ncbi:MAG: NAD(P)-dependent oxidoreductase [Planctomycetia bacterium]|nr:NAD(P)-dependent oxidoreductase [Planctomycetia bacterium]